MRSVIIVTSASDGYVGDLLVVLFLEVAPRLDVVLVLVPSLVALILLVDIARLVGVQRDSRQLRTRADSRRRVGLRSLSAHRLSRLVHYTNGM